MTTLQTERLILRPWRDVDLEPYCAMCADPVVMAHYPALQTAERATAAATRWRAHMTERDWGMWAVEVPDVTPFIGYVGLGVPSWSAHFTPCVEIGWRLAASHWGCGYAGEAAAAALQVGFERVGLAEIVSFTSPLNVRSWRLMERLGMQRSEADDFDHPTIAEGHRLKRHVLYRLSEPQWRERKPLPAR